MFWKMVKARTDELKEKKSVEHTVAAEPENLSEKRLEATMETTKTSLNEYRSAMRSAKKGVRTILAESTGADGYAWKVMDLCEKRPELWPWVLEIIAEDETLADKHQTDILNWIIINEDVEWLLDFISKVELTECDVFWMYKKTAYLMETGDFTRGQATIYSMMHCMDEGELKEFFRISSENKLLRFGVQLNIKDIFEVLLSFEEEGWVVRAFSNIVEFFPECIEQMVKFVLGRKDYTDGGELELYMLQLVADARYGYILPGRKQATKLRDWIKAHAIDILEAAGNDTCLGDIAWSLENEFDVTRDEMCIIFEECTESFLTHHELFDFINVLGYGDVLEYMKVPAGHYAMWKNCYKLARVFPYDIAKIYGCFSNVDAERLLWVAGNPNDSLVVVEHRK